jgi:hypothetical protein
VHELDGDDALKLVPAAAAVGFSSPLGTGHAVTGDSFWAILPDAVAPPSAAVALPPTP